MISINKLRKNSEWIKNNLKTRNKNYDSIIDEALKLDVEYREKLVELEENNSLINQISSDFCKASKEKDDETKKNLQTKASKIKANITEINEEVKVLSKKIENQLLSLPNMVHESTPIGKNEKDNVVVKETGTPTQFKFKPKAHWELATSLDLIDFERAVKISGTRFIAYKGLGAKLYRALQQYTLDFNISAGFVEFIPPVIVNPRALFGTGQLPKFEEDLFKIDDGKFYLSPTAEVQLTNLYQDEVLAQEKLPMFFTANTPCFRSEAGSAGRDTKGVIRLHQFHKTEMVMISHNTNSYQNLETMTRQAEKILENLHLPYRRLALCSGDIGFGSSKTYDIEVWLPSYNDYKEISSCSNCEDFQATRAKIRFKASDGKPQFVHTLNGSGLAIDRLWAAVIENNQTSEGTISIPDALAQYMNGIKEIK